MTLDSVLNVIVPAGIFITIFVFIYKKAQDPIDTFFGKVKEWASEKTEELIEIDPFSATIVYRGAEY